MKDLTCFEPKYKTLIGYLKGYEDLELENILSQVAKKMNIAKELICSDSRKAEIIKARHFYCKLAALKTKKSYNLIGRLVNIDHSTVTAIIKKINKKEKLSRDFKKLFGERNARPIEMLKNGKVIRRYPSVRSTQISTGFDYTSIYQSLKHGWKAKGFEFKYA